MALLSLLFLSLQVSTTLVSAATSFSARTNRPDIAEKREEAVKSFSESIKDQSGFFCARHNKYNIQQPQGIPILCRWCPPT